MMADEQTHTLPAEREALETFARFLGFKDRDEFAAILLSHLRTVEKHYVKLFESAPSLLAQQQNLSFALVDGEAGRETLDRLAELGFRQPHEVAAAVQRWQAGTYRALRSEQVRAISSSSCRSSSINSRARENPDAAFASFDRFLAGLRSGSRLLPLLRQNPELIRFVALILGVAPRLADILAQNPHVIDPLIDPTFFGALPDAARLEAELAQALDAARGYEDMLDAIRLFGQEHMFLIGARILSGSLSAEQAGEVFADLADVLIRALHARVEADFAGVHGRVRGQQTAILALGRLGAREMTASSDLDLIVVYDFDAEHPNSDGKRPLYGAQYFARLTQRLISALTVRTNYGVLYEVDMRLRPSGRSGPLATHIDGFVDYQRTRSLDLGAYGADARARRLGAARLQGAHRSGDCRSAAASARCACGCRRCRGNAHRDRERKRRCRSVGLQICRRRADRYRVRRAISAARARRRAAGDSRHVDGADAGEGCARRRAESRRRRRFCGRRWRCFTTSPRSCGSALPAAFDPKTANAGVLALLARAADLPDFPALQAHVVETERQVRACFLRILEGA